MSALYQPGTADRIATESRSVREAVKAHGADDPLVTIASVRAFAARHHIELREQTDAGQLILFQKPEAVTDALASIFELKSAAA